MVRRCVGVLAGTRRVRSRSSRPGPRTCSPRTSASRRTSSAAVAIGLRGDAPAARRRPLRRRALRRDGRRRLRRGDDPRRRRPQGPPRPRAPTSGAARATCARGRSRPRSRSTAPSWYDGPATLHPARQPRRRCSAASRSSPTRGPDDGLLELGVVHRRGPRRSGRARSPAPPSATRRARRSCASTQARAVKVKLDRKVRYELDGGDRTQGQVVQGRGRAGRAERLRPARQGRGGR